MLRSPSARRPAPADGPDPLTAGHSGPIIVLVSRDAEALRSGARCADGAPLRKASASRLTNDYFFNTAMEPVSLM